MAFELAPALFGLAGTIVGGGVTFAANWLTGRNQRLLASAERKQAVLDRQYAAHLEVLVLADRVADSSRLLFSRLTYGASPEQLADARRLHEESFSAIHVGKGAAQLAGPADLVFKLGVFMSAVTKLHSLVERFDQDREPPVTAEEFSAAIAALEEARKQYVLAAQKLLALP